MKKHIIWSSFCDMKDWKSYFDEEYPETDEDKRYALMYELNSDYLEDERTNLNIVLPEGIICIANLELWNGTRTGYKEIPSRNIRDCLYSQYEPTWYVDSYGNLRCDDVHHDGTNHYLYRMWKPGLSVFTKDEFLDKIYNGTVTQEDIARCTRRIGDPIAKVYGWRCAL